MPVVVIAEKPSVAADIAKVLGVNSKKIPLGIYGCLGYLGSRSFTGTKTPEEYDDSFKNWRKSIDKLPFIPDDFKLKPITGRGNNRKQLTAIKKMITSKDCSEVVNM